ncbi:helix-turn-helix transcriptional regulator [Clostridiaceae bacterium 35-E11]
MLIFNIKNLKNKKISEVIEKSIRLYHMSNREIDIINCLFKGYSNTEIADQLFISTETVKKHLNNVYKKCAAKNRMDLMATLLDI